MPFRDLNLLDAAQRATDCINALIDRPRADRLLHGSQMRASVEAISANIKEGFGREPGPDRNKSLVIARGEAEETIEHLSANFRTNRITPREYWPLRNLLVTIAKMLTSMLRRRRGR